jgi:hypothetical protein
MTNSGIWLTIETDQGKTVVYFGCGGVVSISPIIGKFTGSDLKNENDKLICRSTWEPSIIYNMLIVQAANFVR